jgi:hypothetical protein
MNGDAEKLGERLGERLVREVEECGLSEVGRYDRYMFTYRFED